MMARAVLASIWLLLVLLSRGWLEAHMARHMLLQFPLLLLGGMLLAGWLPLVWRRRIGYYNQLGLNGMVYASLLTSVWMIPSALDLALAEPGINLAKLCSLFLAGVALRLSWQPAGRVLQGFFLIGWATAFGPSVQARPHRGRTENIGADRAGATRAARRESSAP